MQKRRLQIIAFVLLLAFTQKLGLRVMLHNRLHAAAQQNNQNNSASYFQVQCDCLDEALVPLDNPILSELPAPVTELIPLHNNYSVHLLSAIKIFRSLRGPPVS
jgi:hypothetical protein